jgi:hypothetical protein
MRDVLHELHVRCMVHVHVGCHEKKEQEPSYMRASKAFVALIEEHGATINDFYRAPDETTLVLKDRRPDGRDGRGRPLKALRVDYSDTRETLCVRRRML